MFFYNEQTCLVGRCYHFFMYRLKLFFIFVVSFDNLQLNHAAILQVLCVFSKEFKLTLKCVSLLKSISIRIFLFNIHI